LKKKMKEKKREEGEKKEKKNDYWDVLTFFLSFFLADTD